MATEVLETPLCLILQDQENKNDGLVELCSNKVT